MSSRQGRFLIPDGFIAGHRQVTEILLRPALGWRNVRIVKAIYGTAWDGNVKITATPDSKFIITPQK